MNKQSNSVYLVKLDERGPCSIHQSHHCVLIGVYDTSCREWRWSPLWHRTLESYQTGKLHWVNKPVSHLIYMGILFKDDQTLWITSCEVAALTLQYSTVLSRVSCQGSHLPNQWGSDNRSLTCDVAQPHSEAGRWRLFTACFSLHCQYTCLIALSNIYNLQYRSWMCSENILDW